MRQPSSASSSRSSRRCEGRPVLPADRGLGRSDAWPGLAYGAGACGAVLLVLVVAAVIPATNGFLHDSRAQISGGRLLFELGVSIVLLTAIRRSSPSAASCWGR